MTTPIDPTTIPPTHIDELRAARLHNIALEVHDLLAGAGLACSAELAQQVTVLVAERMVALVKIDAARRSFRTPPPDTQET